MRRSCPYCGSLVNETDGKLDKNHAECCLLYSHSRDKFPVGMQIAVFGSIAVFLFFILMVIRSFK